MQHPLWSEWYSRERHAQRLRESEAAAVVVEATRVPDPLPRSTPIRVRLERPSDAAALEHLARSASQQLPRGPVLVAEDRGRLVAAVELFRELELVDPTFGRPEVVELVRLRARQLARRTAA